MKGIKAVRIVNTRRTPMFSLKVDCGPAYGRYMYTDTNMRCRPDSFG